MTAQLQVQGSMGKKMEVAAMMDWWLHPPAKSLVLDALLGFYYFGRFQPLLPVSVTPLLPVLVTSPEGQM